MGLAETVLVELGFGSEAFATSDAEERESGPASESLVFQMPELAGSMFAVLFFVEILAKRNISVFSEFS